MSNSIGKTRTLSLETYLSNPSLVYGFWAYYEDEPFDYDIDCLGYEIGRQLGAAAKGLGYTVKSQLIRRKPKSKEFYFMKNKVKILAQILYYEMGYSPLNLRITDRVPRGRIAQ